MVEVIPSSDKNFLTATNLKILFGSKIEKKKRIHPTDDGINFSQFVCISVWQKCQIACGSL